jgi:hypothetical protein
MSQKSSHGIGGAGNMRRETVIYVAGSTISPPILTESKSSRYTTGIGGSGNMRKYDPIEIRISQDVPAPSTHVPVFTAAGIGGVGNLKAMRERRESCAENSLSVPRFSVDSRYSAMSTSSRASSISELGVADWSKNVLLGRRNSTTTKA